MFAVLPESQGRGLGDWLIEQAERRAKEHFGALAVRMFVIRHRVELIAWYERRGYRKTGEYRPFPYGEERFGIPRRDDLEFLVLEKPL
jgi:ribosomal protein S18 acetylase RimI-like enzyme